MVAFRRRNTVKQTSFSYNKYEKNFYYRNEVHSIEEIRSIKKIFFEGNDEHPPAFSAIIYMENGLAFQVSEQSTFFLHGSASNIHEVNEKFKILMEKTYIKRWVKYARELKTMGYFTYSNWRFYPEDNKIFNIESGAFFDMNSLIFIKIYSDKARILLGYQVVNKKEKLHSLFFRKFLEIFFGRKKNLLSTVEDTDIFEMLMKDFFSLSFDSK